MIDQNTVEQDRRFNKTLKRMLQTPPKRHEADINEGNSGKPNPASGDPFKRKSGEPSA